MISSVSEMYPTAVIYLFWACDFFVVAHRFWLPCHISKMLWTMAILCNFLSSASFFNAKSFSVCAMSNAVQSPANTPLLARSNCLTTTFSQRVSPVVLDSLEPILSCPREKLACTPTLCGIIDNMSQATLKGSGHFECISSCWRHQSVISSNQNVLLISQGSEW